MGSFNYAHYDTDGVAIGDSNTHIRVHNSTSKALRTRARSSAGKFRPILGAAGNSLQAQSYPGYTTALQTNFYSHNDWFLAFLGQQFQWADTGDPLVLTNGTVSGGIYGASGFTTASILVDLPAAFRRMGALNIGLYQGMENDVTASEASYPVASNIADYETVINLFLASGVDFLYWPLCLPNIGINSTALATRYWQLVQAMKFFETKYPQLRLIPVYDLWTDTTSSFPIPYNAGLFADYTDASVHDRKGALWLGKRMADVVALDGFGYPTRLDLPGPGEAGYIGGNPNMLGAAGGFSGGFTGSSPNNLTIGTTLTGLVTSTVTPAVWRGKPASRIDIAAAAQAGNNNVYQIFSGNIATGWSIGEDVQFFCELEYDSGAAFVPTGIRQCSGNINFTGTASVALFGLHSGSFAYNEDILTGVPMLRATPRCRVPVGTTALRAFITALSDTTNAVLARVYVSKFLMINWTRTGA